MSGDGLRFGVLGPLAVERDGEPVALAGARRRGLLALLVLRARERLSSDLLIEELWSGRPPANARTALQMHIRAIRRTLGPDLPLRTVPGGYVLEIAPEASDVSQFERGVALGVAALRDGDPGRAARELADALALWRGPPLVELANMPSAQAEAVRLEELRLGALETRIDADLALGHQSEVVAQLGPLIVEHPYRERLRAQLMLALYRGGRQADALGEFQRARDTLVDELGLEPSEELQRLQRAILAHDAWLDRPPPAAAEPTPDQAPMPTEQVRATQPDAGPRRERKTVTALVASLEVTAGSADPEDLEALVVPHQQRMRGELERFGGSVETFLGATVVALFGLPATHEDDAERAVRAALAIRDQLREDDETAIRVTVSTGQTLVEPMTGPGQSGHLAGSVVDAALRRLAGAPAGGVLVDGRTYCATGHVIVYEPTGDSGITADSWQALAARRGIREGAPGSLLSPMVGRDGELAALGNALQRVSAASSPALVTTVGAPGIGKSRLIQEFTVGVAGRAEAPRLLSGRSLPYGTGVSFWALGEIVKTLAGLAENDTIQAVEGKLADMVGDLVADGSDAELVLRHVAPLVGAATDHTVAGAEQRAQEFRAWRLLLEALAAQRPLVVIFEDLQWADDGMLDFVEDLVQQATGAPLLVLGTARPELLERRPVWGGGQLDSATLTLTALSEAATGRLIDTLADRVALPPGERGALVERSGGNPLYAEQYVQMLADGRAGASRAVPESVRGIIEARLDALTAPEKRLLHAAAVVGEVFWPAAVAAIESGEAGLVEPARLRALERKQLLRRERGSALAGQGQYAFAHMLVRDVAYEQISRAERIAMHLRAADWIGSLGRPDDHAELLAHHHVEALQLMDTLGRDTSAVLPRVRVALAAAGDRAYTLHAFAAAERFYLQARELWSPNDRAERADLLYRTALAAYASGEEHRAAALARASASLLEVGDRPRAAHIEALLGEVWWHAGRHDRCHQHLDRAEELARDAPDSLLKARVLGQLLRYRTVAGRYDPEQAREALALAERLGAGELHADMLVSSGGGRVDAGELDAGERDIERGLRDALAADWWLSALRGCSTLGTLRLNQGRAREALELHFEGLRVGERLGSASRRRWTEANVIPPLVEVGDWDDALARADRFLADSQRLGRNYNDAIVACVRACLRLARDDLDGALTDQAFALRRAREIKDPQDICPSLSVATYVHAELRRLDQARELLDELLAQGPLALRLQVGTLFPALVWAADLLDRREALRRRLMPLPWPSFQAARALLDGDPSRAASIFDEAGAARSAAFVRLRHTAWAGDGQRDEAACVRTALEFFAGVGATRYVRECEHLLFASA